MLQIGELNEDSNDNYHHFICKGVNEKLNYYISDTSFYDMQFMLPMTFLKSSGDNDSEYPIKRSINEHKVSKDKSLYLGIGELSSIHTSYTFRDLKY
jgi:hypothetical protein